MDRENIIRMAGGAGFAPPDGSFITWGASDEQLERFAALVAAAERRACVKVCEELLSTVGTGDEYVDGVSDCIAAIRARRNT